MAAKVDNDLILSVRSGTDESVSSDLESWISRNNNIQLDRVGEL